MRGSTTMFKGNNIYNSSKVKLVDPPIIPSDNACVGALMGSKFMEICDVVFDECDTPSKMIFNLMLNFCNDVEEYELEDICKLITMPKPNMLRWQNVLKESLDIPTSEDLNAMWENHA